MFDNILGRKEGSENEAGMPDAKEFGEMLEALLGMSSKSGLEAMSRSFNNVLDAEAKKRGVEDLDAVSTENYEDGPFIFEEHLTIFTLQALVYGGKEAIDQLKEIDRTLMAIGRVLKGIERSFDVANVLQIYEVVEDEELKAALWEKLGEVINVEVLSGEKESES